MSLCRIAALAFALPSLACQSFRPTDEARWIVDPTPSVRIDWDSDVDGHDLHDVRATMRLADGRIAVVDGGSAEIRYFDSDGALVGRLGGEPAFHRLQEAVRGTGDTLVVRTLDPAIVRVSVQTGVIASRVALDPAMSGTGWLSPDGSLLVPSYTPSGSRDDDTDWRIVTLARYDPASGILDTLGVQSAGQRPYRSAFPCLFTIGRAPDRFFAAEMCSDSISVTRYDGTRIGFHHSGLQRNAVPPGVAERERTRRLPHEVPALYPCLARLLPDRTGALWVLAYPRVEANRGVQSTKWYTPGGTDWIVLDAAGRRIARVRTPLGLVVREIGEDYLIGVTRDDGTESVRMYTLHRHA